MRLGCDTSTIDGSRPSFSTTCSFLISPRLSRGLRHRKSFTSCSYCQQGEDSPHSILGIDIPGVFNQFTEDADKLAAREGLQVCVRMFSSPQTAGPLKEGAKQAFMHDDSNN